MEKATLEWWRERRMIEKYIHRNDASDRRWSFIDGPITANNPMGVHHAWGRSYKDLWQRFHTMLGEKQRYQNGFDCQGLWIEVEVEKEHGFTSKKDIADHGIDKFVQECKDRVQRFSEVQTQQSIRLGYWMDWDNSYYTNSDENNYTIWMFLKTCWERGWVYKGHDTMPWCPRCATGLSEHEIVTEGYREVTHESVYVKFPLLERPGESLLVWTTTPWTLPANVAAAVHPELTYLKVKQENDVLYVSKGALKSAIKGEHEVVGEVSGKELAGLTYRGPFDELPAQQGIVHRVIEWTDVSDEEGTGIVHIAPGCGKEDFQLSKEFDLAVIAPCDDEGIYIDGFASLTGSFVSADETRDAIFTSLRDKRLMYRTQRYPHRYPHCWRCGTELIFRLVDEWFISMDDLRLQIAEVTKQIRWIPDFGLARELDWLKNMDDWMISKKRYYGLALPIYDCEQCGTFEVIGSETELKERAVEGWEVFEGHSPHKPFIDAVKIACKKCGAPVSRIPDVGNPWLDAGIVPYSTLDYRHDKAHWSEWFPAAFITEAFPGPVPQLVLLAVDDVHGAGEQAAVPHGARARDGSGRARRGDAQEQGQRHLVRGRGRQHGRRRDAVAVLPAEPGEQRQLRLRPGRRGATGDVSHAVEHVRVLRHVRDARRLVAGRGGAHRSRTASWIGGRCRSCTSSSPA